MLRQKSLSLCPTVHRDDDLVGGLHCVEMPDGTVVGKCTLVPELDGAVPATSQVRTDAWPLDVDHLQRQVQCMRSSCKGQHSNTPPRATPFFSTSCWTRGSVTTNAINTVSTLWLFLDAPSRGNTVGGAGRGGIVWVSSYECSSGTRSICSMCCNGDGMAWCRPNPLHTVRVSHYSGPFIRVRVIAPARSGGFFGSL